MEAWRQYQEDAADYFRSVGLQAETDVNIRGVRSNHRVDVLVRSRHAGMDHLWIVECKDHVRAISKDRPLLLRQIVDDVGADKGILLAESGFQRGAREVVRATNTLVTSLAELRGSASDEILRVALGALDHRVRKAQRTIHRLSITSNIDCNSQSTRLPELVGLSWPNGTLGLIGSLSLLESGIKSASDGEFPAPYRFRSGDSVHVADRALFVPKALSVLQEMESRVAALSAPLSPSP